MRAYPDLLACGISFMQFSFHVSDGMEKIDSFWEARGFDRSKERLLFAGYSRKGKPHTVYLQWERSHDSCSNVSLGLDARRPSEVWPKRPLKYHRLRENDSREFIKQVPTKALGIRARYAYPWAKGLDSVFRAPPHARPVSFSFNLLDEKQKPVLNVTYRKRKKDWLAIVEPLARYPFPEGDNFFEIPYEMGCSLAKSIK